MKRFVLVALALAPATLPAQRLEGVGGGLGVLSPTGSFGEVEKIGWYGSLTAAGTLKRSLGFTIDAVYGQTTHKDGVEGKTTLMGVTAHAVVVGGSEVSRVRPFAFLGAGPMRVAVQTPNFGTAVSTKLAFDFGGGARFGGFGNRRQGFVTVSYLTVKTSPRSTAFLSMRAGVLFRMGRP